MNSQDRFAERSATSGALVDMTVQQRNLLLMKPLFQFELNRRSYVGPDGTILFDTLDTHYLCLVALTHMMEGTAVAGGFTWPEMQQHLIAVIRQMQSDLSFDNAGRAAERVLKEIDNGSQAFEYDYYHAPSGKMRPLSFRLVRFEPDLNDEYRYRPTEAGYLVLMGMLDLEIEDHQQLVERMLKIMIERGRFDTARELARRARLLSIEHRQMIQEYIRQAFRAPGSVSWVKGVEPRLNQARDHASVRRDEDRQMSDSVQEQLYKVTDPESREHLASIRKIISSAHDMRISLLEEVMRAGEEFLKAQQIAFRPRTPSGLPDLFAVMLPQVLGAPKDALSSFSEDLISSMLPPQFAKVVEFGALVHALLDLRAPEAKDEEPNLNESLIPFADYPDPFPSEMVTACQDWLGRRFESDRTWSVSDLLVRAEDDGHSRLEMLCIALMLYRSYPETENLFPHMVVEREGFLRHEVMRGDDLRLSRRVDA